MECAGFLAELVPFLPEEWASARWNRPQVLQAALNILLFAAGIGFSDKGALFKYVDLNTGQPLPDVQAGVDYPTAPWWNVRELCAAALKLYDDGADGISTFNWWPHHQSTMVKHPDQIKDIGDGGKQVLMHVCSLLGDRNALRAYCESDQVLPD